MTLLLCIGLAFAVNWLAFVPAYLAGTERFFDLTGSITYLSVVVLALILADAVDIRSVVIATAVVVWALRLGTFLFRRVIRTGADSRFDKIKTNARSFFITWTLQALWVSLTAGAAVAAIGADDRSEAGVWLWTGAAIWLAGFAVEAVADAQKSRFRSDPANSGRFITSGLWSWSRHPNYVGEIVLWFGVAVMAAPNLSGTTLLTLVSPVFVWLLLTRISGLPMLERRAQKLWGDDPQYRAYVERTPVLFPTPSIRDR